jgi:hypothetical protein
MWGLLLLALPQQIGATPLAGLHLLVQRPWIEGWMYLGASLGTAAMFTRRFSPGVSAWLGIPQQGLLMLGAGGSLWAIYQQQFADGVPRHWAFILAGELPIIVTMVCHTGGLLAFHHGANQA